MKEANEPQVETKIDVVGAASGRRAELLTPAALTFLATLERRFGPQIDHLLAVRRERQRQFDRGIRPDFLTQTRTIRESDWTVAPLPQDLRDRRVEITGPVQRKMIINGLNSGAKVFMADLEDATSPTWDNVIDGQVNLYDAVRRTIDFVQTETGKRYALNEKIATLIVRPRGLHLSEDHLRLDGRPLHASLVDFGLMFFHNANELLTRGSGPYFYLPKLESHREARLWNDVFIAAQDMLGIRRGTIKATVLIETITAAFEMDEILYELRDHSAGLNCGRWDYIFSFIKKFSLDASCVMPDRAQVTMTQPFMRAYTQLTIRTCHRRGVHAMGGMAAQIPIANDADANATALKKVRDDKLREVQDGHDGTWVAHPALVPIAMEIFNQYMPQANQIDRQRNDVDAKAEDLLAVPQGTRTEEGLRHNIRVGVQYLAAWLRGNGCVPLYNLMEDAATAEISRAQVWQWLHHQAVLEDGKPVTTARVRALVVDELQKLQRDEKATNVEAYAVAARLFDVLCTTTPFSEFLTVPAYDLLLGRKQGGLQ